MSKKKFEVVLQRFVTVQENATVEVESTSKAGAKAIADYKANHEADTFAWQSRGTTVGDARIVEVGELNLPIQLVKIVGGTRPPT